MLVVLIKISTYFLCFILATKLTATDVEEMIAAQLMADAAAYVRVVKDGDYRIADMKTFIRDRLGEQREKRNNIMKSIEDMLLNGKLKMQQVARVQIVELIFVQVCFSNSSPPNLQKSDVLDLTSKLQQFQESCRRK